LEISCVGMGWLLNWWGIALNPTNAAGTPRQASYSSITYGNLSLNQGIHKWHIGGFATPSQAAV